MRTRITALLLALAPLASAQPATTEAPPAAEAAASVTPLGRVETRGTGPVPMILIPGANFDGSVFSTFMDRNAERYTMFSVTLPGFGGTEPPPEPEAGGYADGAWLENAEDAILALIREQNLASPVLVGHQLGAHVALRIAAAEPAAARAVVAIEGMPALPVGPPGASPTPEQRASIVERAAQQLTRATEEQYRDRMKQSVTGMVRDPRRASALADMAASVPLKVGARYYLEMLAADVADEVRHLRVPTLMIAAIPPTPAAGTSEQMREHWRAAAATIPGAQLVFFESTTHFVTEDAPAELDVAIERFLAGEPVPGRAAPANPSR